MGEEHPQPYRSVRDRVDAGTVRAWAQQQGIEVSQTGGLPRFVYELYLADQSR